MSQYRPRGSIVLRWRLPATTATTRSASSRAASAASPPSALSSGLWAKTTVQRSPARASWARSQATWAGLTAPREPPSRFTVSSTMPRTSGPRSNA